MGAPGRGSPGISGTAPLRVLAKAGGEINGESRTRNSWPGSDFASPFLPGGKSLSSTGAQPGRPPPGLHHARPGSCS